MNLQALVLALGAIMAFHTPTRTYINERPFLTASLGQIVGSKCALSPFHCLESAPEADVLHWHVIVTPADHSTHHSISRQLRQHEDPAHSARSDLSC